MIAGLLDGLVARARSLLRGLRGQDASDAEMEEEFRLHIEMRADDLVGQGVPEHEAMRIARAEFGSTEWYKDEGRRARGLRWFDDLRFSWLDVKLGARMLARYPGLSLVGGVAMAFAIWVGAGGFELVRQILAPSIPLPQGDRIVALRNWDVATNRVDHRVLHDFLAWREELTTVREIGAFRALERNLVLGAGDGEPVEVAEISASAFGLVRVPPLLGRALVESDERSGAPAVAVIGHDVWTRRFDADSSVVGRSVRLGGVPTTIVGVMPEGFAFPIAQSLWVPLRLRALDHARREGPRLRVFGRLAPGATLEEARAELATLGRRASADFRETHEQLRPQVMPHAHSIVNVGGSEWFIATTINLPLLMLLVLVCGNVALLTFARAASREGELAVRSALGASRTRIVMQLFAEALVLGGSATVVGLSAAGAGLAWFMRVIEAIDGQRLPFWYSGSLSPTTILYAAGLTVLGAVVAGVVPALKVTRGLGSRLREATAGGGGLRFGGVWTAVIVAQVAVTVAFPAAAFVLRRDAERIRTADVGFPDDEYLAVRIEMDDAAPSGAPADTSRAAFLARYETQLAELERRLTSEHAVLGVTWGQRLPRSYHPHRLIEVDSGGAAPLRAEWPAYRVSSASVDPELFDVLGVRVRAGRGFRMADVAPGARAPDFAGDPTARADSAGVRGGVVIVNEPFVELVLGGRNPIGRHIRYLHFEEWDGADPMMPGAWHEIVGVVPDLGMAVGADVGQAKGGDPKVAGIYHPASPGAAYPVRLAIHVRGDPAALAPRLRAAATAVDPRLRLYEVGPLDEANRAELQFLALWFRLVLGVSVIALFLSLAGIYAVMAFTVSRRTREIGIRVALGASRRGVVLAIFRRPLAQVAGGIAAGTLLVVSIMAAVEGNVLAPRHVALVVGYALLMMLVCLLACIVPTRRALGVEPMEVLREE